MLVAKLEDVLTASGNRFVTPLIAELGRFLILAAILGAVLMEIGNKFVIDGPVSGVGRYPLGRK